MRKILRRGVKPLILTWLLTQFAMVHAQTIDASSLAAYMNQIASYTKTIRDDLKIEDGTVAVALKNDPATETQGRAVIASSASDGYGSSNASQYFTLSESQMCDQYKSQQARQLCSASRNVLAASLSEIDGLLKSLESNRTKLLAVLQSVKVATPAALQELQLQITVLQTLMQNDMARIQLSVAAHQQKHALYQQQLAAFSQQQLDGSGIGMSFKIP